MFRYLVSYLLHRLGQSCDLSTLRKTNTEVLALGVFIPSLFLFIKRNHAQGKQGSSLIQTQVDRRVVRALHSTVNICLFPTLFFFSGLYYTDVASTACVLWFLQLRESELLSSRYVLRGFVLVIVGLLALCFRQTNIFWVAIFPAALDLVSTLKTSALEHLTNDTKANSDSGYLRSFTQAWEYGVVYDPASDAAHLEGEYIVSASLHSLNKC